ncbi:MAG: hypothetical protein MJ228_03190 [Bacilli bacterium]|nr:hypothetical protein [Bacilli bacterium]
MNRRIFVPKIGLLTILLISGCAFHNFGDSTSSFNGNSSENIETGNIVEGEEQMTESIILKIDNEEFSMKLDDNSATKELVKKLPLTVSFSDYGGFEKVGSLGFSLPRNDEQMTTNPGDVVLYDGDNIVVFYGSNSWKYTKLGHIDDVARLTNALSGRNVEITFMTGEKNK